MRISDWSSDVCSSDLPARGMVPDTTIKRYHNCPPHDARRLPPPVRCLLYPPARPGHAARGDLDDSDRKSVVSGKSVSVRVDLGGRRCLKTKRKNTYKHQNTRTTQRSTQKHQEL